jgi:hypothetical protein
MPGETESTLYRGREVVADYTDETPSLIVAGERIPVERTTLEHPDGSTTECWKTPESYYPTESLLDLGRLVAETRHAELCAAGRGEEDAE